jgi:HK97 family phage portal protein
MFAAIARVTRAVLAPFRKAAMRGVDDSRGWIRLMGDIFAGSWQRDIEVNPNSVLAQATVFSCLTLIKSDIGKLRLRLVKMTEDGIWQETSSPAFSPVLRKPNRYQTRQQFIEQWVISLLSHGNAFVLKDRDQRGIVTGLYVLDPRLVRTLVALDGAVYYQLNEDDLNKITEQNTVPASEIIHDRINTLFHPLVGLSPIFACGLAATQALNIQRNSALFFENMSKPGGILTAPGSIPDETAERLKKHFQDNFSGGNIGKVAVLGDGLTYEAMSVTPIDAQLVEQLKMSAEQICSVFHVPAYMVGAAPAPAYNNIEALNQQYYSQCLQALIEGIEAHLDEGLNLPDRYGTEFNLDDLLRMDSQTLTNTLKEQVGAGISEPNEARKRLNLPPAYGGNTPYMQQQNYSLAALAKRDAQDDPFGKPAPAAPPSEVDQTDKALHVLFRKAPETLCLT